VKSVRSSSKYTFCSKAVHHQQTVTCSDKTGAAQWGEEGTREGGIVLKMRTQSGDRFLLSPKVEGEGGEEWWGSSSGPLP